MSLWKDNLGMVRLPWVFALGAVICGMVIFSMAYVITAVNASYGERQCSRFEQASGLPTEWRKFSHWSFDCYARLNDGTYLPTSQLRGLQD